MCQRFEFVAIENSGIRFLHDYYSQSQFFFYSFRGEIKTFQETNMATTDQLNE